MTTGTGEPALGIPAGEEGWRGAQTGERPVGGERLPAPRTGAQQSTPRGKAGTQVWPRPGEQGLGESLRHPPGRRTRRASAPPRAAQGGTPLPPTCRETSVQQP